MPRKKKSLQELQLSGTYRADRHKDRNIELSGPKLLSYVPLTRWTKETKSLMKSFTLPQIAIGQLYEQDIPSLNQMGEILNEIELLEIERTLYEGKKLLNDEETDVVILGRFIDIKIKLIKTFDQLIKPYLASPYGRLKAMAVYSMTEKKEVNSAINVIDQGIL